MENIFQEILAERQRQIEKFGIQDHPILDPTLIGRSPDRMCDEYDLPTEGRAKQLTDSRTSRGELTYMHVLVEEVAEAASCDSNVEALRKELIQIATVTLAMIESLDRNGR